MNITHHIDLDNILHKRQEDLTPDDIRHLLDIAIEARRICKDDVFNFGMDLSGLVQAVDPGGNQ